MTNHKSSQILKAIAIAIAAFAFLGSVQSQALAADDSQAEVLHLRKIMQELGNNMQAVTAAISQEDWARIVQLAPKIAEHHEPPLTEKARIMAYLGTDTMKFRSFDKQVHEAALAMKQAAANKDGKAVIGAFARIQESCLGCHQTFRKPFVEHFYGLR